MENGKRLVGILKHSILINAPGPQTLFANSVVVAINVPGILTFSIYFFFLGGGAFIGTNAELGKSVLGPAGVYLRGGNY